MFFWGVIWPLAGILFLVGFLALTTHFHRRRARRLAEGWQLVENTNPLIKTFSELAGVLMAVALGIKLAEISNLHFEDLFVPAMAILILLPKQKWVRPVKGFSTEGEI